MDFPGHHMFMLYFCFFLTGTLLFLVCSCNQIVIEIPIYKQPLCSSKQMCVFLFLQWSLVVATITEIPPLVFLPNFLVQRKVLRPLRTQTGGTIMVGPLENLIHTIWFQDLLLLYVSMLYFDLQHRSDISSPFPVGWGICDWRISLSCWTQRKYIVFFFQTADLFVMFLYLWICRGKLCLNKHSECFSKLTAC